MHVYIIGASCTRFKKSPEKTFKELTREAFLGVLADAAIDDGHRIDSVWFGNCGMGSFGQRNIRGQVCLTPLVREGLFPERVPVINVEGGCATGSIALNGAWKDVLAGTSDLVLAIGVEKTSIPDDPARVQEIFEGGIDQFDPSEWIAYYSDAGRIAGKPFAPKEGGGTVFMDTYAMQAAYHMKRHGSTQAQLAIAASKSHYQGSRNPLAQYQFEVSVEDVLNDRVISHPLTRSMCAPIGDGAAAALVCSERYFQSLSPAQKARAVKIRACHLSGGKYRSLDEPGLSHIAAQKAYAYAGLAPHDVDLAEVHDATSFSEIYQAEMMGFCPIGEGGRLAESGATAQDGRIPINMSGGLVSKGHPVGATGLSMVYEMVSQLRGEAGARQVKKARIGLIENGGGVVGFDEAVCGVTLLEGRA